MFLKQRTVALGLALCAVACGGKSMTSTPNESGGAASAGGAGAPATTMDCPVEAPMLGVACSYQGGTCTYELSHCNWLNVVCFAGHWASAPQATSGASYDCSSFAGGHPKDGDSCECQGLLDCTYNECSGAGSTHAVCDDTSWHVTQTPCADRACGMNGLRCKPNEACLHVQPQEVYSCLPDPCAEQFETTSCACASSLCDAVCGAGAGELRCYLASE